jgi:DNA-binding NtrC family response regulator
VTKSRVLLIEDEVGIRFAVKDFLQTKGYEVLESDSCAAALAAIRERRPDVVICDYRLPDGHALELLPKMKELERSLPVVILTGHASVDLAVQAIKEGAEHFLTKPVELQTLDILLKRMLENERNRRKQGLCSCEDGGMDPFVGTSAAIRTFEALAKRVVASDAPILIQGETGAGKGILARWLHDHSPRSEEPFVNMNCAGLSAEFLESDLFGHERGAFTGAVSSKVGLLEHAHRGVVFLDEIGDMDLQVQPKLLKVLEEKVFRRLGDVRDRAVDIRLIAASHQDLKNLVQTRRFRNDLYFRINTVTLVIPPLRERREDILPLTTHILGHVRTRTGRQLELSAEAQAALHAYHWPGNIRELRNVLERAALLADRELVTLKEVIFEPSMPSPSSEELHLSLAEVERRHIERVLAAEGKRVEAAAKRLGISRSTLYDKLKQYGALSGN